MLYKGFARAHMFPLRTPNQKCEAWDRAHKSIPQRWETARFSCDVSESDIFGGMLARPTADYVAQERRRGLFGYE